MFEFGSCVGVWRIVRLLRERGLAATVFACALALERNAAVAAAIRDSGYVWVCRRIDIARHWRAVHPAKS
jgi:hypothetical protein